MNSCMMAPATLPASRWAFSGEYWSKRGRRRMSATCDGSKLYPRLYHITSEGSWPSIQQHGLLSTEALLDLFGADGELRASVLAARRPDCVPITHPQYGRAIIRDQKPLIESKLRCALQDGMTPREWYELLNRKTFFWVAE